MLKANFIVGAIAAILMAATFSGAARADASTRLDATSVAFIKTGGHTSIPYAALDFCRRDRKDCAPSAHLVPQLALTQALWTQLLQVNAYFNSHIIPETDEQQYHVADLWTYPTSGYGDCEDIQLAKQQALVKLGWPASVLLMTVVRDQDGEGHAVLMVRTDRGDFILDNEDGLIERWDQTPYQYLKRQSQANPADWVDLVDTRAAIVVAKR